MSHLSTFMGIVQALCEEDAEIEELLKETENLLNMQKTLENETEEAEREHTRLQMELFNMKLIMLPLNNLPDRDVIEKTNQQLMESCVNIRYALSQIDYVKILQCKHMEMEQTWRKEWQKIQDSTVSMLKWHKKMEERDVVKKYRQVETGWKTSKNNLENCKAACNKSANEARRQVREAKDKRQCLIVSLAETWRDLNKLRKELQSVQEYRTKLDALKKKNSDLDQQIQDIENKNFKFLMPYQSSIDFVTPDVIKTFNCGMPKFPTFNEILSNFNQEINKTDVKPEITVIENTTNITVKSILRNSQDNSMEINQSITTNHTKHVRFKVQLEEQFEFNKYSDSAVSETSSDESQDTTIEKPITKADSPKKADGTNKKENTPVIDLLTPMEEGEEGGKNGKITAIPDNIKPSSKSKVDILECIVLKPAESGMATNKENIAPKTSKDKAADPNKLSNEEMSSAEKDMKLLSSPPNTSDSDVNESHTSRQAFADFDYFMNIFNEYKPESSRKAMTKNQTKLKQKAESSEQNSNKTQNEIEAQDFDIVGFGDDTFLMDSNNDLIDDVF
uniref:Uncharacterized protein n=1 Tax=Musca domestica TaxID=7370 RepID=A0A1I8MZX6_MUSDO